MFVNAFRGKGRVARSALQMAPPTASRGENREVMQLHLSVRTMTTSNCIIKHAKGTNETFCVTKLNGISFLHFHSWPPYLGNRERVGGNLHKK